MIPRTAVARDLGVAETGTRGATVLFLLNSLTIGGSERKAIKVVNELHRRGWNVHVGYLNAPTTLLQTLNREVPVVCLGRRGKLSVKAICTLRSYIRKSGVSGVVCVNLYPLIYAMGASGLLPASERPSVWQLVNTTEHIDTKSRVSMVLYRPLMRRARSVVFGCRAQLELWCELYGLDEARCRVIYNGVDEGKYSPGLVRGNQCHEIRSMRLRSSDFVIGTVGQLRKQKNQLELISAFSFLKDRLHDARLVIVGEGPERNKLEAAAKELGVGARVMLTGALEDVRPAIEAMDLFVLSSVTETFSNAALEAMSMAKTVILSDVGGAREMVRHGVNGYVYASGDAGALATLIEQLAMCPDTRRSTGESARATVLHEFSVSRMVGEYENLLMAGVSREGPANLD